MVGVEKRKKKFTKLKKGQRERQRVECVRCARYIFFKKSKKFVLFFKKEKVVCFVRT